MKNLFLTICLVFFALNAFSQDSETPISVVKKKKFYQNEQQLTGPELKYILSNNPSSAESYQKFNRQQKVGLGFLYTGVVVGLGGLLLLDNLTIGLVGLGIELVAVPLVFSARKHLNTSVDQFNNSLSQSGKRNVSFEFMANSSGLGVRMRF